MIQKLTILFLIYFETCSCFQSHVNFDISEKNQAKKFPWMVTIVGQDEKTFYAYGSLIHEKAVLTLNKMDFHESVHFDFKVFAKCYNDSASVFTYSCAEARNVTEYHIIGNIKPWYQDNLVLLILSEPFTLSLTVNIISFARSDRDYDLDNCIVLSLRRQINSQNNFQAARLFVSTAVKLTNRYDEIYQDFYTFSINVSNGFNLTNDQNQTEEFIGDDLIDKTLDFVGGPLTCKSKLDEERWLLVGGADLKIIFDRQRLQYTGQVIRTDFNIKQIVIEKVIKNSFSIPISRQAELILKYN